MAKNNCLKLVHSKPKSKIEKLLCSPKSFEFNVPRFLEKFFMTDEEKAKYLKDVLSSAFADYDEATESVDVPAHLRAKQTVENMKLSGTLNYYYKFHKAYLKQMA